MFKYSYLIIISVAITALQATAQKNTEKIEILTSAQCEMCKNRIETAMAFEKGIISSELNLETKVLTVIYKIGKTTPDKIRIAINKVGYDADGTPANVKAYNKLPPCCKKPDDPGHISH